MKQDLITYLPWLLSTGTIATNWFIGNRAWYCWYIGLATQAVWFVWIPLSGTWGLLPTTIFLTIVFLRNLLKWRREL